MAYARDRNHVLRHYLSRLHAASIRQNHSALGQRIYLGADTRRPVRACQIVIANFIIYPGFRGTLNAGKFFPALQKSDIHHIPRFNLGNRHGTVMLILHIGRAVIIEGIRFPRIHIDKGNRLVVRIRGQNYRRIRRIVASHRGKRKARIHHVRLSIFILCPSYVACLRSTSCQNKRRQRQHCNSTGNSSVHPDHFLPHFRIY